MDNTISLIDLKLKLASYGPIRPEVWPKILPRLTETDLKINENFIREIGSVVYVVDGLLKEYDAHQRKNPSIINFISAGNFLVTSRHNQFKYIKAICPTKLLHLNFDAMISLFLKNNELYSIYNGITADYEDGIAFRQLVLEESTTATKIQLFIKKYRPILSRLKKKDIANYIHVDYEYFIRIYGKLL